MLRRLRVGHPPRRKVAPNRYMGVKARIASAEDGTIYIMEEEPMKVVAGIDVGKKQLVVSVAKGPPRSFDNAPKGIAALLRFIRKEGATVAVCEATGGYERPLVSHLRRKDVSVCVAPPNKVRSFAHAMGYQAKTDAIDAIVISHYGEVANLSIMPAADPAHEQLKELLTRRKQLVNQKVQEANRLSKSLAAGVRKSTERHLKWLDKEIKRIDKEYRKTLQKNPHLSHPADLYRSVPGIGELTAASLVAFLPELGHFGRKQLTSLVGLAPWARDSGSHKGHRSLRGGRGHVRRLLYMAAMTAVRRNPDMTRFYQGLLKRGKPGMVALASVMRKLLLLLNTIAHRQTPWIPLTSKTA